MSSKGTIILTTDNEHWYHDCSDDTINLEINLCHCVTISEDCYFVEIKKGTPLFDELWKLAFRRKESEV